jgi:hypothetical protein
VKCEVVEELKEDDVKLLAHIIHRYNQKPSPIDYISVLSIIKGFCADNDKHTFVFHEDYDKVVADTIKEYQDAITKNVERKADLEKIENMIVETNNQIKSLQSTLGDLDKKKEYNLSEMNSGGILIDSIKLKFLKLTGTEDMNMWS